MCNFGWWCKIIWLFRHVLTIPIKFLNQDISLIVSVIHGKKALDVRIKFILTLKLCGLKYWKQRETQTKALS